MGLDQGHVSVAAESAPIQTHVSKHREEAARLWTGSLSSELTCVNGAAQGADTQTPAAPRLLSAAYLRSAAFRQNVWAPA